MLTKAIEVQKYVRASAGRAGLNVVFEDINQPRHNGKTIFLPKITAATSDSDLKQLMASTDHEVAHDRFSSFEVLQKYELEPNGLLMFTWNFLEDSRINTIEATEYRGFRENYDECSAVLIKKLIERFSESDSIVAKMFPTLLSWEGKISAHLFPKCEAVSGTITCDRSILDVLHTFSSRLVACHKILNKADGTEATYKLAYDILKTLGKEGGEEFRKLLESGKKPSEKTIKEVSDGKKLPLKEKSPAPSSEKVEGTDDKSGEKEKSTSEEDDEYKVIKVVLSKEDFEKFSLSSPEEGQEMGKIGLNFDPVPTDKEDWFLTDFDKFEVVNYPKNKGRTEFLKSSPLYFTSEYKSKCEPQLVSQENFAQQVRRLIQIRARVQTQYGVKKGKLDQSRLSRICFDAPGFNERVFKQRIENKTLDAAISILVDMSGSMSGEKAFYALASTLLMNEVCSTLNIPLEVVGFSDFWQTLRDSVPLMFVYKGFNDLRVSHENMIEYFAKSSNYMTGNPDGENLLWSYERLLQRKEKKRILIVMSDGAPAASRGSVGLQEFTSKVIKEIEKAKKVHLYGLGLLSTTVEYYYKNHSVVTRPNQIPNKLIELIEKRIINV